MDDAPIRVLFVCTGNSARSQIVPWLVSYAVGALLGLGGCGAFQNTQRAEPYANQEWLQSGANRIANLSREIQDYYWNFSVDARLLELRNLLQVAELIVGCALQRHESRGLHYSRDYPQTLPVSFPTVLISERRRR